jgi:hypothetical protein
VKSEESAYTSASTAENQKVSENAYARAPVNPAPIIIMISERIGIIFYNYFGCEMVMLQNRKRMVNALASADIIFMLMATFEVLPAKRVKKRPSSIKKGHPEDVLPEVSMHL